MSELSVINLWLEERDFPGTLITRPLLTSSGTHLRYELDRVYDSHGYMASVLRLEDTMRALHMTIVDAWARRFPWMQSSIAKAIVAREWSDELGAGFDVDEREVIRGFYILFHLGEFLGDGDVLHEYKQLIITLKI
jgi:hypothetical protein